MTALSITRRILSRHLTGVRYVRQDNAGPACARNHGARLAQGEFLAFTDSDCVPHEDWISQLMAGFTAVGEPSQSSPLGVVAGSYGIANPKTLWPGVFSRRSSGAMSI